MRVRGLKFIAKPRFYKAGIVAPRAGAWIEIEMTAFTLRETMVAPRAGAWIEIPITGLLTRLTSVAPRAGAWIEIKQLSVLSYNLAGRTPCGCVD